MPKKLTIDDIARLAGVSRTTISRVLNHKPDVDPATREHILQIMEEQHYVPNTAASGLATGRSRLIGMLIPDWSWPLIYELIPGIVDAVKQTPYELVLYSIDDEDIERDRSEVINRLLASQLTAGLLAIYPAQVSQYLTRLYKQGFPVVIIDDQQEQVTPWVSADNLTGAYSVTRHLIELGHRRIAHIQGPAAYLVSHDRYEGYRRALAEAGITPDPALVLEGDFMPPSGRACASKLFALPPEQRPTAIFASTDQMAYGVLSAAEEFGIAIPRDVALVGFDDDAPSAHTLPALTTIRQPYFAMGQRGIELLLAMLDHDETPAYVKGFSTRFMGKTQSRAEQGAASSPERVQLPTSLVVRESCGANYRSSISTSSVASRLIVEDAE